jgi:hypothetical protein
MTLLRTESFVPLTAAAASAQDQEFKVAVIPVQAQSKPFHTLQHVSPETSSAEAADKKKLCEPKVSVQRDGDRVSSIRIQCTCGQVMDIACTYDEPAQTVSA